MGGAASIAAGAGAAAHGSGSAARGAGGEGGGGEEGGVLALSECQNGTGSYDDSAHSSATPSLDEPSIQDGAGSP